MIGLGVAKIEIIGSAAGLEYASHVLYRPSSLKKVEMRRKGYGVNTGLIYMYCQTLSAFYLLCGAGRHDSGRLSTTPPLRLLDLKPQFLLTYLYTYATILYK